MLIGCAATPDTSETDAGAGTTEHDGGPAPDAPRVEGAPLAIDLEELVFEAAPAPPSPSALPASPVPRAERDTRAAPAGAIVVEGWLFYDDLRHLGNADRRLDPEGGVGALYPTSSRETPPLYANLLGALDVTVDLHAIGPGCAELLGSASVGHDGSYRVFGAPSPSCGSGIAVAFRLSSCHEDYCVHVDVGEAGSLEGGMEPEHGEPTPAGARVVHQLWHPRATPAAPARLDAGTHDAGRAVFGRADEPGHDIPYQAAAVFAAYVDAMRYYHVDHAVPYDGVVRGVLFPGIDPPRTAGGTVHIGAVGPDAGGWRNIELWHEHGHQIWNGGNGCSEAACPGGRYLRNGEGFWGRVNLEWPYAAYNEGFADFSEMAVAGTCAAARWDDNETTPLVFQTDAGEPSTAFDNGIGIPRNVTRFFCDLLDERDDDDPAIPGAGDRLRLDITEILEIQTASRRRDTEVCDFVLELVARYPDGRGADVALQNGLDCAGYVRPPAD